MCEFFLWARGYYVSTVGRDERIVREYMQQEERRLINFGWMSGSQANPPDFPGDTYFVGQSTPWLFVPSAPAGIWPIPV
jgi:hypothetical protein